MTIASPEGSTASATGQGADDAPASATGQGPDDAPAHHPPIDCPLREAGHDPTQLRPFEDVERYIAFLERADRAAWQKPDAVIEALRLAPDEVVVDLGAGSGYFAFRFAQRLLGGQVEALDVEPEMVRHLHHTAMVRDVRNLSAGFVDADAPRFRPDATLVFVCDVLHHAAQPQAWLSRVAQQLPASGRLALIEFREGPLPEGPPEGLKISRSRLLAMAERAGLVLKEDLSALLPYQHLLIFERAADAAP